MADPADAGAQPIDVPAGDLVDALALLATQTGIEFVYDAEQLKGIKNRSVNGILTRHAAVTTLLEGTHLTLIEHDGAMLIAAPPAGAVGAAESATSMSRNPAPPSVPESTREPPLDDIVVTGTHVRGEAPIGSPLVTYERDAIDRSGSATVDEFARNMTQDVASVDPLSSQSSNARFAAGSASNGINAFQGASFNLHGLGPSTTLTLLNGQRLAPGGLDGSFTDISLIPLSAVDHIEVLPDGASAIYGTDAVAGVVNIITRKDFSGAETSVRHGAATEGGAREVTASQIAGTSWGTGNVLVDYEYDDQNGLSAVQRTYLPPLSGPDSLLPESRRHSIFVNGSQELGAVSTVSGDVLYSDRQFAAANTFNNPPSSPAQTTVASGSARELDVTGTVDRALFGDWHLQVTGNYSMTRQTSDAATSIAGASIHPDTVSLEAAAPSIAELSAVTQGSLLMLPGGPVKAALGASYRLEKYAASGLTDPFDQAIAIAQPASKRQVFSAYTEIVAPVVLDPRAIPGFRRFDLSISGRYDYYTDFNSTLNPKLGLSWDVVPGLVLRGTFGTSFQAPLLSQSHRPLNIETEFLPDDSSPTGSTDTIIIQGGNLGLKPETSKSYTGGLDLTPATLPGLVLNATFFYINFTNKISTPPTSTGGLYSLDDPLLPAYTSRPPIDPGTYFSNPGFLGDFTRLGPSAVQAIFDDQLTNLGTSVESGLDMTMHYALPAGPGRLNCSLEVDKLFENNSRAVAFGPVVSLLNAFAEPPKWKGRGGAVWTQGHITASAVLNYVNSYQNTLFTPSGTIGAWATGDVYLGYKSGDDMPRVLRRWVLSFNIVNVTDAHPPRARIPPSLSGESVLPFDPVNASPVGRLISLSLDKRW